MLLLLASYPGLLTPSFVTCSTDVGKGLVKLSHVQRRTWTCGGVAYSFCTAVKWLSESKKCRQNCVMSSTQLFYGPCLWSVAHSLSCCFSRNVPLLHTSRYVIGRVALRKGLRRLCPHSSDCCRALMLACRNSLWWQHCKRCNNVLSSFWPPWLDQLNGMDITWHVR